MTQVEFLILSFSLAQLTIVDIWGSEPAHGAGYGGSTHDSLSLSASNNFKKIFARETSKLSSALFHIIVKCSHFVSKIKITGMVPATDAQWLLFFSFLGKNYLAQ